MMRVDDAYTTQKDIKHTTSLNDPFMNMCASFLTSSKGIQLQHACIQGPTKIPGMAQHPSSSLDFFIYHEQCFIQLMGLSKT
jgi:hypothetical protein